MRRKPKEERDPWALAFAEAIYRWLEVFNQNSNQESLTSAGLARRLDIPIEAWYHATAANSITKSYYYARVYCFTGIPEADPRTIPPRQIGSGTIPRAMSEDEWTSWMEENERHYSGAYFESTEEEFQLEENLTTIDLKAVAHQIDSVIENLHRILESDETTIQTFAKSYRLKLTELYMLATACTVTNPKDREAARKLASRSY